MTKWKKIAYWFFTCWLALGMVSTGIVQLMHQSEEAAKFQGLGYPAYLMTLIGVWKMLGTLAVLAPRLAVLKEWAYAGFFFTMSGALASHIAVHAPMKDIIPPILLLTITMISWALRPLDRKAVPGIGK
jgi:uncharacterized membrane protein YphA (DoxX/SURF4 family)